MICKLLTPAMSSGPESAVILEGKDMVRSPTPSLPRHAATLSSLHKHAHSLPGDGASPAKAELGVEFPKPRPGGYVKTIWCFKLPSPPQH